MSGVIYEIRKSRFTTSLAIVGKLASRSASGIVALQASQSAILDWQEIPAPFALIGTLEGGRRIEIEPTFNVAVLTRLIGDELVLARFGLRLGWHVPQRPTDYKGHG
jgi:hypothetical protein